MHNLGQLSTQALNIYSTLNGWHCPFRRSSSSWNDIDKSLIPTLFPTMSACLEVLDGSGVKWASALLQMDTAFPWSSLSTLTSRAGVLHTKLVPLLDTGTGAGSRITSCSTFSAWSGDGATAVAFPRLSICSTKVLATESHSLSSSSRTVNIWDLFCFICNSGWESLTGFTPFTCKSKDHVTRWQRSSRYANKDDSCKITNRYIPLLRGLKRHFTVNIH